MPLASSRAASDVGQPPSNRHPTRAPGTLAESLEVFSTEASFLEECFLSASTRKRKFQLQAGISNLQT